PLLGLPLIIWHYVPGRPAWASMWLMAFAIFAGCKWLTWCHARRTDASVARHLGYLLAWPGMNAEAFLGSQGHDQMPARLEWAMAWLKPSSGAILVFCAAQFATVSKLACWTGIAGMVLFLHFGAFHLLSCAWRRRGVDAPPIMDQPLSATSVHDFWARRWNTA